MNFDSNTAPLLSTTPSRVARHPLQDGMVGAPLHVSDDEAGIGLNTTAG